MKCGVKDSSDLFKQIASILMSDMAGGLSMQDVNNLYIYEREALIDMINDAQKKRQQEYENLEKNMKKNTPSKSDLPSSSDFKGSLKTSDINTPKI